MLLEDGLSYVRDDTGSPCNDPGGRVSMVTVPVRLVAQAIAAALDCPGECIFLEDDEAGDSDDADIVDAELVDPRSGS
jgi:ferredoxin